MGWTERQLREDNSGIFIEVLGDAYEALEESNQKRRG